jgi:hypothetical protein
MKTDIHRKKQELEEQIESLLDQFVEDTGLCPYWVKVYWRPDENDNAWADVEVHCGTEFKLTSKDR